MPASEPTEELTFALVIAFVAGFDSACDELGALPRNVADRGEMAKMVKAFIETREWMAK